MEPKNFPDVGRLGRLDLRFRKRDNRTILFDSFSKIPLQAFQPFYPDKTGCAFTFLVNPTGGLVSGDRMDIRIELDEKAHAFITSPSATKVYRSSGSPSLQDVEITLKRDSVMGFNPLKERCLKSGLLQEGILSIWNVHPRLKG